MANVNRLRDWWEGISPREQRLIVALGATAIVVVLILVGLRINDGLRTIEQNNRDIRFALDTLQSYRLSRAEKSDQPQVPIPDQPVKLETYLEGIANEVGISIPSMNPVAPETRGGFVENSTRFDLRRVSIYELKDFLQKVESKKQTVVVKQLNIKPVFRDNQKLNATMIVTTYSKVKSEGDGDDKGTNDK
ncbi:MAG: type II secretion system protein M [Proteobacteria bacterium]|nr:type II secretion system protein M [Pseudomonadota bacterium]